MQVIEVRVNFELELSEKVDAAFGHSIDANNAVIAST